MRRSSSAELKAKVALAAAGQRGLAELEVVHRILGRTAQVIESRDLAEVVQGGDAQ